ncbi:hypothetical protein GQ53DRAFT_861596 [Thozetella sp. PMI_491]|nr:hypothetical protein GQ53DRAFT_861596 [Thozetella sp. PMI_491]
MPDGYPRLASLMPSHADVAIFRRFSSFNALNLLYMQAELTDLEIGLQRQTKIDAESGHFERLLCARDWQTLSGSASEAKAGHPLQWTTIIKIKEKLCDYNTALCLQRIITNMDSPQKSALYFLRSWMETPSMGNV